MKVETTRFGTLDVDEKKIVYFTQPILGFSECQKYIIVEGPGEGKVWWLQSCEVPELAFIVMDPMQVVPDYEVRLDASEVEDLRLEKAEDEARKVHAIQIGKVLLDNPDASAKHQLDLIYKTHNPDLERARQSLEKMRIVKGQYAFRAKVAHEEQVKIETSIRDEKLCLSLIHRTEASVVICTGYTVRGQLRVSSGGRGTASVRVIVP